MENKDLENTSYDKKKLALYLRQKKTLDEFLARGAISKAQYDKSFGDLTEKMGMEDLMHQEQKGE